MNSKFLLAFLFFISIFVSPFAQRVTIAEAHIVSQRNDVIRWAQSTAATKFYQVFLPIFNLQNYEMPISEADPKE